jgi:hypothetical protein
MADLFHYPYSTQEKSRHHHIFADGITTASQEARKAEKNVDNDQPPGFVPCSL